MDQSNIVRAHKMTFTIPGGGRAFEIPDDWWLFADMEQFRPNSAGYYLYNSKCGPVEVVSLESVEPPCRDPGIEELKKYKLVPVLLAFQSPECALPPVQVKRVTPPSKYQYRVHNGFHRFYASVAAGYSKLPVMVIEQSAL